MKRILSAAAAFLLALSLCSCSLITKNSVESSSANDNLSDETDECQTSETAEAPIAAEPPADKCAVVDGYETTLIDEDEPNDSFETAKYVRPENMGNALYYGVSDGSLDLDHYYFTAPGDDILTVQIMPSSADSPITLHLYAESGDELALTECLNDGGDRIVSAKVKQDRRYYLLIQNDGNENEQVNYILYLFFGDNTDFIARFGSKAETEAYVEAPGGYQHEYVAEASKELLAKNPPEDTYSDFYAYGYPVVDEDEPNDDFDEAKYVRPENVSRFDSEDSTVFYYGKADKYVDFDFYYFIATGKDTLTVSVDTHYSESEKNPIDISIYDSNGYDLETHEYDGDGLIIVSAEVEAGQLYYIQTYGTGSKEQGAEYLLQFILGDNTEYVASFNMEYEDYAPETEVETQAESKAETRVETTAETEARTEPETEPEPELIQCKLCEGTGICFVCSGDGKCTFCGGKGEKYSIGFRSYIKCEICKGTGNCNMCDGSGLCESCDGSGYRIEEEADEPLDLSGVISTLTKDYTCRVCRGTGCKQKHRCGYCLGSGLLFGKDCPHCEGGKCDECNNRKPGCCSSCGGDGVMNYGVDWG